MNKYKLWHDSIIQKAQLRTPVIETKYEKHHIIPKSVGGTNDSTNLVHLTYKEHFIVHLLLTKIYTEPKQKKSLYAAYLYMSGIAQRKGLGDKRNSRLYESYRKQISEMYKGAGNHMFGKTQSDKQKEAVRLANKGKIVTQETRDKMSIAFTGRKHTEESNERNRQAHLGIKQSKETIQKRTKTRKLNNKPQTDNQKKIAMESNQKTWKIYPPEGEPFIIQNLRQFCISNNLDQGNMTAVSKGRLKQHKGYRCELIE